MKNSLVFGKLGLAYKQFINDLHDDPDFKEFKKRAWHQNGKSFGVVVINNHLNSPNKFTIDIPINIKSLTF